MKISNRTFGVEIETIGLSEEEIIDLFEKHKIENWRVEYDQSIENYEDYIATAEIISPILTGYKGIKEINKVCNLLKKSGVSVNETCGLHVHVGVKDLSTNEIFAILNRYRKYENFIDKFVHPSRRKNKSEFCSKMPNFSKEFLQRRKIEELKNELYSTERIKLSFNNFDRIRHRELYNGYVEDCKLIKNKIKNLKKANNQKYSIEDLENFFDGRYYKVNVLSYNEIGTLEFRQHNGSVEPKIISNWIKFVLNFVEQSVKYSERINFSKNSKTTKERYDALYKAFLRAPKRGITKERIAKILNIQIKSVPRAVKNMKFYYRGSTEAYNGRIKFNRFIRTPKDNGPLMGLPTQSKTFFIKRSKSKTKKFEKWAA